MNQTYIHLLMNHIPVVGTIFALFVLLYGIMKRSYHTQRAAYFLLILEPLDQGLPSSPVKVLKSSWRIGQAFQNLQLRIMKM